MYEDTFELSDALEEQTSDIHAMDESISGMDGYSLSSFDDV